MTTRHHWLTLAWLTCISACGGSTHQGSPERLPSEGDFLSEYAAIVCKRATPCCTEPGHGANAGCVDAIIAELQAQREGVFAITGSDAITYDASVAGTCLTALESLPTSCSFGFSSDEVDDVCGVGFNQVFVGQLGPGEACTSTATCSLPAEKGSSLCSYASGTSPGVCVQLVWVADGAACASDGDPNHPELPVPICLDSSFCNASSHRCEPIPTQGEPCGEAPHCTVGLACGGAVTPICFLPPGLGEACEGPCVLGARCDKNGVCVAKLSQGAACTMVGECESDRCIEGVCLAPSSSVTNDRAICL